MGVGDYDDPIPGRDDSAIQPVSWVGLERCTLYGSHHFLQVGLAYFYCVNFS